VLSVEEEAIVIAFRRHTLLPLDDCLYALQATIPHLTRSSCTAAFSGKVIAVVGECAKIRTLDPLMPCAGPLFGASPAEQALPVRAQELAEVWAPP